MISPRSLPSAAMLRTAAQAMRPAKSAVPTASRAFTLWTRPTSEMKHWTAPPRPSVKPDEMPINPGPPPPESKIGVNAILKQTPETLDRHTTTIFSEFSLEGMTAVVTGGNRGLGLEMALAYVEAGAHVYVIDLPEEPCEEFKKVAEHCHKLDRQIEYISGDVTNVEEMNEAMPFILDHSGTNSLDICVACAGVMQTHPALDYPIEEFRKVLEVNTIGVFITAQAAARVMYKQENVGGSIILIGSMSGTVVNRPAVGCVQHVQGCRAPDGPQPCR